MTSITDLWSWRSSQDHRTVSRTTYRQSILDSGPFGAKPFGRFGLNPLALREVAIPSDGKVGACAKLWVCALGNQQVLLSSFPEGIPVLDQVASLPECYLCRVGMSCSKTVSSRVRNTHTQ